MEEVLKWSKVNLIYPVGLHSPLFNIIPSESRGVQPFGISGRRRVVLGHTLNTQTLTKTDEQKKGFK